MTYDIQFHNNENSDSKGFAMTKEQALQYVHQHINSNDSYFADYKGGVVQVVCNENGEVVYEQAI